MSAGDSSVKGSSQQSWTSGPKVKEGGLLFSGPGPLITEGLVKFKFVPSQFRVRDQQLV